MQNSPKTTENNAKTVENNPETIEKGRRYAAKAPTTECPEPQSPEALNRPEFVVCGKKNGAHCMLSTTLN